MGNFCSSVSTKVKTGDARKSRMNQRISLSLEKIKEESAKKNDSKVMTLEKIILRFDRFRSVLKLIKDVFHDISGGRSLDFEGLHRAMSKLHGALEKEEVRNLFDFIDLDDSHEIELKEFLVALVIGYVLDAVPTKNQNEDESGPNVERQVSRMRAGSEELNAGSVGDDGSKPRRDSLLSVNTLLGKRGEIREMMSLIVEAHLLFDTDVSGVIYRKDVERILTEQHGGASRGNVEKQKKSNPLMNDQRWAEMDWNADGSIDFAEFVFCFCTWVDLDDDMDEAEQSTP